MRHAGYGIVLGSLLLAACAQTDGPNLTKRIKERLPQHDISSVTPTPYKGLYEVVASNQIVYTDEKAQFFLLGDVIDAETMKNLTQARMEEMSRVKPETLPLDLAIKEVRGTGKRTLVVFSDPDCPFCKKLEFELAGLQDVTIYTFLYPLPQLHPEAREKAINVWCAPNRQQAWQALMLRNQAAPKATCDHPVDKTMALGQKLNISGTPTMFLANGQRIAGALKADQIEELLDLAAASK